MPPLGPLARVDTVISAPAKGCSPSWMSAPRSAAGTVITVLS